jgi:hypothetical protein
MINIIFWAHEQQATPALGRCQHALAVLRLQPPSSWYQSFNPAFTSLRAAQDKFGASRTATPNPRATKMGIGCAGRSSSRSASKIGAMAKAACFGW